MKVVATAIFVFFLVESIGRKLSLAISALGMGVLFYIIGAILIILCLPVVARLVGLG